MAYATNADLPDAVRALYSDRCQTVFRDAFNRTKGDEATAFAFAHTAAKTCMKATASKSETEDGVRTTAAKFVEGRRDMIEGLAIPFGGPIAGKDLDGEDFGPDTDFSLDWFPEGRPTIYHHGKDGAMKTSVVGRQVAHDVTEAGIWARVQLDTAHAYHAAIAGLVDEGALGFSSGSVPHLVETTKDGHITRWPWIELSLTPTPANPAATVYAVKATDLVDRLASIEGAVPAPLVAAALKALDGNRTDDPDALPDGASFGDTLDRLLVVASAQVQARKDWRAKSGRVLSAATRERLAGHPEQLRQLATDIEALLSSADAGKAALAAYARFVEIEARLNGVPM